MENNNSSQNRSFGKAMLWYLKVQINFDIFTGKPLIVSYIVAGIIILKYLHKILPILVFQIISLFNFSVRAIHKFSFHKNIKSLHL